MAATFTILKYDETKSNARYKAVMKDGQLVVAHIQNVDTLLDAPLSQLSLCSGVLESDAVSSSVSITKLLIEKIEDEIVYRSRDCLLLFNTEDSGNFCQFCRDLFHSIKVETNIKLEAPDESYEGDQVEDFNSSNIKDEQIDIEENNLNIKVEAKEEEEDEGFALLNSFQQIVEQHDAGPQYPYGEAEVKTNPVREYFYRMTHDPRKQHKCERCEKSFMRPVDLRKHISQVHDKLKPFYCENCQFRSGTVSNLNIHRMKSHNSPKLSKKNLIEMVETGQHPYYTLSDLPMIRRGPN